MRVVTSQDKSRTVGRKNRIVKSSENPKPNNNLTQNEIKARLNRRYATSTTFGAYGTKTGASGMGGDVMFSGSNQFYSPQLSTDFLEKPQNIRERRAFYRFFYNTNEIVGQAIDIHSTLPLSKIRLVPPRGKNHKQNEYIFKFFENMCQDMKLFKALIEITHEYFLFGNCFIFAEEDDYLDGREGVEQRGQRKEESRQRSQLLKEKYNIIDKEPLFKGWKKLIVLPPDQVRVRKLPLSDDTAIEYLPDPETKKFITSEMPTQSDYYSTSTGEMNKSKHQIPSNIAEKVRQSGTIPLDTDPYTGSHVFHLARKKSQYEPLGVSIVERCINTLVLMDKLRQAQTSIASRHMTPMRIVWAEDLSPEDVDNLREQVDMALVDPDYSIIANYEVHWEEMGSNGRLLDIEADYEGALNRLFAGLGVTREVLTGEGTYAGNRISLEIMNQMYLLFREIIQDYVENNLFKPIARKKGFVELDEFGNETILYPRLSFTRLSIRDNEQFFDAAFQLYQKGSISIDLILDILNIDPVSTKEKLESDMFTVNDSQFNEVLRNSYADAAQGLVDNTDLVSRLAEYMKLKVTEKEEAPEGSERFSSKNGKKLNPEEFKTKMAKVIKYFKDNPERLERLFEK